MLLEIREDPDVLGSAFGRPSFVFYLIFVLLSLRIDSLAVFFPPWAKALLVVCNDSKLQIINWSPAKRLATP